MSESYNIFILTIGRNTVGVYSYDNISFKVFDSHARDLSGRSHAQGTCVLLELASINNLIQYFQSIHNDDIFEIKGIEIKSIHNILMKTMQINPVSMLMLVMLLLSPFFVTQQLNHVVIGIEIQSMKLLTKANNYTIN